MCDEPIQVGESRGLDIEFFLAYIVDSLIINHERAIRVLQSCVSGQNRVIRLNNGCGCLRGRINAEFELALLAIICRQTLHNQSAKARASTTTEGVEDEETLETAAIVSKTADFVASLVDELLSDSVMATSVVVGGVLLASEESFGVEQRLLEVQ